MADQTLQEWLESPCGAHDIEPVRVTIDGRVFEGCRYKQTRQNDPSTAAYRSGKREYVVEAMYLLGEYDERWHNTERKKNGVCFTIEGDDRDWYLGSWAGEGVVTNPQFARFHYGVHFLLFPWSAPGTIDGYREVKYERRPIEVETVEEPVAA